MNSYGSNFKLVLIIDGCGIFCKIVLLLDLTDDKSIFVRVMAWCHQWIEWSYQNSYLGYACGHCGEVVADFTYKTNNYFITSAAILNKMDKKIATIH